MEIIFECFDCRAYDRAAIKFRGVEADINFNVGDYDEDLKQVRSSLSMLIIVIWLVFQFEGVLNGCFIYS